MAKDPAFLFYPNDWIGGTMTFSRHLKGCYHDVLMVQFNSGPLSLEEIKTVLGLDFESSWPTIQKKFKTTENGLFFNERLEFEKEKRRSYSESRRINKAGKKKEKSHEASHDTTCVKSHEASHDTTCVKSHEASHDTTCVKSHEASHDTTCVKSHEASHDTTCVKSHEASHDTTCVKSHEASHDTTCVKSHEASHENHMIQHMENANMYLLSKDVLSEKDVLSDQIVDNAVCETKKNEVENLKVEKVEKTDKKTETPENAIRGDLKKDPDWMVAEKAAKAIAESKAHSDAVEAYLNSTDEERAEKSHKAFIERAKNPPPKPQTLEEIRDRSRFLKEENRKYLESLINEAIDPEYLNAMRTQFKWKCDVDQELSNFRLKVTVTAPSHYAGADLNRIRFAFQNHLSNCKNTKKFSNGNQTQPTALVAKVTPPYTGR